LLKSLAAEPKKNSENWLLLSQLGHLWHVTPVP